MWLQGCSVSSRRALVRSASSENIVQVYSELAVAAGVPWQRPANYYVESVKSDAHMARVKQQLMHEQQQIEEAEQRCESRSVGILACSAAGASAAGRSGSRGAAKLCRLAPCMAPSFAADARSAAESGCRAAVSLYGALWPLAAAGPIGMQHDCAVLWLTVLASSCVPESI